MASQPPVLFKEGNFGDTDSGFPSLKRRGGCEAIGRADGVVIILIHTFEAAGG